MSQQQQPNRPNNKRNNNRNNRTPNNRRYSNYFTRGIQSGGQDFIDNIHPQKLEYDVMSVFRDLSRGNIKIEDHFHQFSNPNLLMTMEKVAFQSLAKYTEIHSCITFKINSMSQQGYQISPELLAISDEYGWKVTVYNNILYNVQYFRGTMDLNYIIALASFINRHRRYV